LRKHSRGAGAVAPQSDASVSEQPFFKDHEARRIAERKGSHGSAQEPAGPAPALLQIAVVARRVKTGNANKNLARAASKPIELKLRRPLSVLRLCALAMIATSLTACVNGLGHGAVSPGTPSALLPARVRRLTNVEYERSVSELLATRVELANELPPDLRQDGYTRNAAQVLPSETLARLDALTRPLAHDAAAHRLAKLVPCAAAAGDSCARELVETLGRRAFRRPIASAERERLLVAFDAGRADGGGFAGGAELVLRVLLLSPSFIYTSELGAGGALGSVITLDPYEIASELSYTVRGGPPDETLLAAAADGSLLQARVREREARRLVAENDTRHQFRRFVLEWLEVDGLEQSAKTDTTLVDYDALKSHMLDETRGFVDEVMVERGGSLRALLTAGFASVDAPMARFYGLHGYGAEASLAGSARLGILQQASFLAAHAHEDASSPVKRGDFVMRRLLCQPVKRPGEVGIDIVFPPPAPSTTTRERFDAHTMSTACSGCHAELDQLGFTFENFDEMGRARTSEHGQPVRSQAVVRLSNRDVSVADSRELSRYLADEPRVSECFARQAFRYFSADAEPGVERSFIDLSRALPSERAGDLVEQVVAFVKSELFVKREVRP
jgi:hypothetical protein